VRIEGYTDSTGSADYNLGLSDRRANAVRSSLLDMGINSDRITTRGYGQESPVAGNDTAMGRQLNRRVEIILSDETDGVSSR
jgi:outer membrane protein OmpA-like peptidoglycan-associated protein